LADLIRVHALAVGSTAKNSFERLDDIIDAGILPKGRAQNLKDALEFMMWQMTMNPTTTLSRKICPTLSAER